MANKFQDEMSEKSGIAIDYVPPLRLAICSGRDIQVELPDGRTDWVGDSARRAKRASEYCLPNEIIIDEPVRYFVFRDFNINHIDIKQRPPEYQPKKMEEEFPVYVLGKLKTEVAAYSEAPEYFVYTLNVIGKVEEATTLAQQFSQRLGDEASGVVRDREGTYSRILRSLNRLIASLPDYSTMLTILKSIRTAGLAPDVITYNTLINRAPDYETAKAWLDKMLADAIQPNVVTYSTLIKRAPDYETAKAWLEKMHQAGIQPNVQTYNWLINMAPNYETAIGCLDKMRADGIQPNVDTYNTLIWSAPGYETAIGCLDKMRVEGVLPDVSTYNTLIWSAPD
jgi:hypothetical protein